MTRPASGASTTSGANSGSRTSPAASGPRPWTSWRNRMTTNSMPSVQKFIVPAGAVGDGERRAAQQLQRQHRVGPPLDREERGEQRGGDHAGHDRALDQRVGQRGQQRGGEGGAGDVEAPSGRLAALPHDRGGGRERDGHDRHVDEEHAAPAEPGHQRAAEHRAGRERRAPHARPHADRPRGWMGRIHARDDRQRARQQQRRADALHHARRDERRRRTAPARSRSSRRRTAPSPPRTTRLWP